MRITFVSKDRISLAVSADPLFSVPSGSLHLDISGQPIHVSGPDNNGKFTITLIGSPTTVPPPTVELPDSGCVGRSSNVPGVKCSRCRGVGIDESNGCSPCRACDGLGYLIIEVFDKDDGG